jgi:hypothetical protein
MPRGVWERPDIRFRIFSRINRWSNAPCWEWTRGCTASGYAEILFENRMWKVGRLLYVLYFGGIPKGMWVLHKCDNRKCVNPNHLYLGNINDNSRDAVERRRNVFGERSGRSKLTNKQAEDIRNSKENRSVLSKKYGVLPGQIYRIRSGKSRTREIST